jgi:hypothetical protein
MQKLIHACPAHGWRERGARVLVIYSILISLFSLSSSFIFSLNTSGFYFGNTQILLTMSGIILHIKADVGIYASLLIIQKQSYVV